MKEIKFESESESEMKNEFRDRESESKIRNEWDIHIHTQFNIYKQQKIWKSSPKRFPAEFLVIGF